MTGRNRPNEGDGRMRHRPGSALAAAGLERFSGPFVRSAASCAAGAVAGRTGKAAGAVRRRWDGPDGAGRSRGPRHGDARGLGGDAMRDLGPSRAGAADPAVGSGEIRRGREQGAVPGRDRARQRQTGRAQREGAGDLLRGRGGAGRDLGFFGRGVRGRPRCDGVRSSGLVGGRQVGPPRCDGAWKPSGRPGGLELDRETAQRHNPALRPVVAEQPWGAAP
jgi:hypothetical protein